MKSAQLVERVEVWVCVGLGVTIPATSFMLSHVGAEIVGQGTTWVSREMMLGGGLLACTVSILAVSLSHIASSIERLTRSAKWQAWLYAITIDCALILLELVRVLTEGHDSWLTRTILGLVVFWSAMLNTSAFLSSWLDRWEGREERDRVGARSAEMDFVGSNGRGR